MNFYGRDFLRILDFSEEELRYMLETAKTLKRFKHKKKNHKIFPNNNIAIIFEKTSTRTRCSFEVAAYDLGMGVTYLDPTGSQMGHKESIADTARVLSRFYDGIEFRGFKQETVNTLAEYADVPVWNGLTDECHPTQVLADFMTIEEHFGHLKGLTLAFVGDSRNNVANSLMAMSAKMGVNFISCGPRALRPADDLVEECRAIARKNGSTIVVTDDLRDLEGKVDAVYADVWLSMGEDKEKWGERIQQLKPYQVTMQLMDRLKPNAVFLKSEPIFLHALPSFHNLETSIAQEVYEKYGVKEMEVTDEVFESDRSLVFEEAENRMHTIKAVMFLTLYKKEKK
ncbi:ornithine carbamoyltransferase [Candidatus Saccharibacteria bacterium]|nr:ornithine carbamoyltransferase [Candidatus Saccharibacteria bacterium]